MESEKTAEVSEQISQHEQSSHQENIPPALDYDHENVRAGYWRSWRFIGSVTAIVLMANSLYFGYILPVSVFLKAVRFLNLTIAVGERFDCY